MKSIDNKHMFTCEKCEYTTIRKSDYIKHCHTKKHIHHMTTPSDADKYQCKFCDKIYKDRSGLWRHQQQYCVHKPYEEDTVSIADSVQSSDADSGGISKELIYEIVRQNKELKTILLEERNESKEQLAKIEEFTKVGQNIIIHNTTNQTNHFNLNVFLNEQCKHAISMMEFINSLQVGTDSVEYTGKYGYVDGITKIFMDGLRQLDVYKRPIHCTDLKRETLYIKENNTWEKDTQEKTKMRQALVTIAKKNMQQIQRWQSENPKCEIPESKEYILHLDIMHQSIGGGLGQADKNNIKIIKNIAKEVIINRDQFRISF
jgi:hypothetical protein